MMCANELENTQGASSVEPTIRFVEHALTRLCHLTTGGTRYHTPFVLVRTATRMAEAVV
jgi:hypothetical protein